MNWRSSFVRVMIFVLIMGVAAAGSAIWREHQRSERIQAEIDKLEQEAGKIRKENESLKEKIQYFASPDFYEREAKEKLGYRRLEEKVVVFQGEVGSVPDDTPEEEPLNREEQVSLPNYQKWWALFFH